MCQEPLQCLLPVYSGFNSGPKLKVLLSQEIQIEYFKSIHTGGVSPSKETDMAPAWEITKALIPKKIYILGTLFTK